MAWSGNQTHRSVGQEEQKGNPAHTVGQSTMKEVRLNSGEKADSSINSKDCTTTSKDQVIFHVIYQTKLKID